MSCPSPFGWRHAVLRHTRRCAWRLSSCVVSGCQAEGWSSSASQTSRVLDARLSVSRLHPQTRIQSRNRNCNIQTTKQPAHKQQTFTHNTAHTFSLPLAFRKGRHPANIYCDLLRLSLHKEGPRSVPTLARPSGHLHSFKYPKSPSPETLPRNFHLSFSQQELFQP